MKVCKMKSDGLFLLYKVSRIPSSMEMRKIQYFLIEFDVCSYVHILPHKVL
jgi:hypothetical protein